MVISWHNYYISRYYLNCHFGFFEVSFMKKIRLILFMVVMLFVCSSCSKKGEENNTQQNRTVPEFTPLTDVVEGRKNIYLIIKVLESNYWEVVVKGAAAAGKDMDCNVYYSGTYTEEDWKSQEMLLDKCVELGADAIILAPNDSMELAPKVDEIHEKHIPIVLVDTAINSDGFDVCYMTDNLLAGYKAAAEMIKQLKEAGCSEEEKLSVGIMVGTATSQTINERMAGFYQYWTENAPENWKIVSDIKNCNGNMELGKNLVASLLKDNPEIRGLYATNNTPTKAVAVTVSEQGRSDIVVVGFDYSDEIRSLIDDDSYHVSTILQHQFNMSYKGVASALSIINGDTIDTKFEDTGVIAVSRENLESPDVKSILENN